jgi:hypothetical protein
MDREIIDELASRLEADVPGAAERIYQLLSDEGFYDMCSEYAECKTCLRRLAEMPETYSLRIDEYTNLIEDIEHEVLRYLEEHPS